VTAQHGRALPDDCAQCRKGFVFLHVWHQDDQDGVPTAAQIAHVMGLSPRMALVHIAHLTAHGRLCEDRRTPAPGATVGRELPPVAAEELDPLQWVANVSVPFDCRACATMLGILAAESRGTWRGQIGTEELAKRTAQKLGKKIGPRTLRMHLRSGHRQQLGHSLVGAGLVAFETADGEITGKDQHGRPVYVRRPDRFILWPSQARKAGPPRWNPYTAQGAAARLLGKTPWFDPSRPQADWVVRLVAALLERDCPEAEIVARLDVVPRTSAPLASQYRFARRRLVPLLERKTPWTRPAPETTAAVPMARPTADPAECPRCRRPAMWRGRPHQCEEPALPGTEVDRVPLPACRGCGRPVGHADMACKSCGTFQLTNEQRVFA
jgi:hypothetical protein